MQLQESCCVRGAAKLTFSLALVANDRPPMTGGSSGRYLTTRFWMSMAPAWGQSSGGRLSSTTAGASDSMGMYSIMRSTEFMLTSSSAHILTIQFIRPAPSQTPPTQHS